MKKRRHNPNLAKIHRTYTVDEATGLYNVYKGTVRNWIKAGLPVIDDRKPMIIMGSDLRAFHRKRNEKNKQKCKLGEIYCLKCRAPKMPDGGMLDFKPVTEKIWNLVAICPDCYTIMNQRIGLARLIQLRDRKDITLPQALQHIVDSKQPSVNSDLKRSEAT